MTDLTDMVAMAAETLDPELAPFVVLDGPLGPMLKHPLVYDMTVRAMPGYANRMYRHKREALAAALAKREYAQALWLYERPYRLPTLWGWWQDNTLRMKDLRALLPDVWKDTEAPHQFGATPLLLFKAAGFLTDDRKQWAVLRQHPITLYRGCGDTNTAHAISWTTDRALAAWFARRFNNGTGCVWSGVLVDTTRALGYFTGRGENEVVVQPRHLVGLQRSEP